MNLRGDWVSAGLTELHCLTDQTLLWQRRLMVRLSVNFAFLSLNEQTVHTVFRRAKT